jgi:hypothetical protein
MTVLDTLRRHFKDVAEHDSNSPHKVYSIRWNSEEEELEYWSVDNLDNVCRSYKYSHNLRKFWTAFPRGQKLNYQNDPDQPSIAYNKNWDLNNSVLCPYFLDKYKKVKAEKEFEDKKAQEPKIKPIDQTPYLTKMKGLDLREETLKKKETEIKTREQELNERSKKLTSIVEPLKKKELIIKNREQELDEREKELDEREQGLDEREKELDNRRDILNNRRDALNQREIELDNLKIALNERETALGERERKLDLVREKSNKKKTFDILVTFVEEKADHNGPCINNVCELLTRKYQGFVGGESKVADDIQYYLKFSDEVTMNEDITGWCLLSDEAHLAGLDCHESRVRVESIKVINMHDE